MPDAPTADDASSPDRFGISRHPAVRGRETALAALSDAVRDLMELTVTTAAPSDVVADMALVLRGAADALRGHVPATPLARFADGREAEAPPGYAERGDFDEADGGDAGPVLPMHAWMPYDPVIGRYNPLAVPLLVRFEPPVAVLTGTFTTRYEGAPGCVHGSALAGAFDIALTAANYLDGAAGPTVRLALRFRRPTLIGVESRFEAEVTSRDARRVHSRGRLVQDGIVTVEAEGEFATLERSRVHALRHTQRRTRRDSAEDAASD